MVLKDDIITIESEEEILSYIEQYARGEIIPENITFGEWPNLTFKLTGEKFQGSITPSIMKGFIEVQSQINKAYSTFKYGDPEKRLSAEEKEAIEIVIVVAAGSSMLGINLTGFLNTIGKAAIDKMTPQDIIITVLGIALVWGGVSIFKKYLDNRKEARSEEIKKESDKQFLDSIQFMSEQETKRMEIIQNIIEQKPIIKQQQEIAADSKAELLRSFSNSKAETVEFDDVVLDQELLKELSTNGRRKSIETRIDGIYRVEKVDSSDSDTFKVTVRDIDTDKLILCIVQDVFLDEKENKEILQRAEWDRKPLHLSINAKMLDGEISSAIIIHVKDVE
ncbi:hypothetical protein ID853_11020 [Xenorhabdus sp. Vera]|nr:hypothetical protein [Xenorhabdus sp. Vera]MBD2811398.1 hypothetical protein [Xenorhabdus sp. Vera]